MARPKSPSHLRIKFNQWKIKDPQSRISYFLISDESLQDLYSSSDPYSQDPYYSSEDLNAEHRQAFEEEAGFLEKAGNTLERTWTDVSSFFWSKLDEGMGMMRGFIDQPAAVARQAFAPLSSFLPSINEVRKKLL